MTRCMSKELEEGDGEDIRERQEHTGVMLKLDDCKIQRILENLALDEEEVNDRDIMETERYLEPEMEFFASPRV